MDFKFKNNHIVVDIETDSGVKLCVFDTGSPVTFFFDPVAAYTVNGAVHNIVPNHISMLFSQCRADIENMIGMRIDGLIGTDAIMEIGEILIDFPHLQLSFDTKNFDKANAVPMSNIFGLPIFRVSFNGIETETAYDSGAMYSFMSSGMIREANLVLQDRTYEDFNPMLGSFTASLYHGNISIGGTDLGIRDIAGCAGYDSVNCMLGVKAVVGNDTLRGHSIWLSYRDNQIVVF